MATLVQYKNDIAGVKIAIEKSPFRIGRSEDNDLCINDFLASREHALIERVSSEDQSHSHYVIRDLDSTNGTYVNHEPISKHLLNEGDMIRIGQTFFKFTDSAAAEMGETKILKKSIIPGLFYTSDKKKK
jgi:pSer/pThr/pTyr-binding forkhead associated (FHA) protein